MFLVHLYLARSLMMPNEHIPAKKRTFQFVSLSIHVHRQAAHLAVSFKSETAYRICSRHDMRGSDSVLFRTRDLHHFSLAKR